MRYSINKIRQASLKTFTDEICHEIGHDVGYEIGHDVGYEIGGEIGGEYSNPSGFELAYLK